MGFDIPSHEVLSGLLGRALPAWNSLAGWLEDNYVMDVLWADGRKAGPYEKKYRRGGKTLCCLYPREGCFGFMVIFGKAEREKFENMRAEFSQKVVSAYENSTTYHDGKWIKLEVTDLSLLEDAKKMLLLKRKPNKK